MGNCIWQMANGKPANGKLANGKLANRKLANGKLANGKLANGKLANGKMAIGKLANGKQQNRKFVVIVANHKTRSHLLTIFGLVFLRHPLPRGILLRISRQAIV